MAAGRCTSCLQPPPDQHSSGAISRKCLSVRPVFPKMFQFISYSSKCSISAELHFNAALFLKRVGIFPLFCRFPVAPSHSCFSAASLFGTGCSVSQVRRGYTTNVLIYAFCMSSNKHLSIYMFQCYLILYDVIFGLPYILPTLCFWDNYAHLEHHLSAYMCVGFLSYYHSCKWSNLCDIVFLQMPKILWNFNESQWKNRSLQWLRRYKVRANKHAGCWK